jgi:hypothetical protein
MTVRTRATALYASICGVLLAAVSCGGSTGQIASGARTSTPPSPIAGTATPGVASSATFTLLPFTGDPGLPYPIKDCSDAGGVIGASDPVALVQPHGKEVALRDYADPAHPRTLCRFSNTAVVQLIDSRHIVVSSFAAPGFVFAVVDIPQMTHHFFQLPHKPTFGDCEELLGVSPGLDAVTWRQYNAVSGPQSIHVTTAAGDRVLDTLLNHPDFCGNGALFPSAAYSPSGRYSFLLDREFGGTGGAANPSKSSLLVFDSSQVPLKLTPPTNGWARGAEPSMPVWSSVNDILYYQQNGQIWSWTPATGARQFLPGVSWCYPTLSADGRFMAYGALRPDGLYDVALLDLTAAQAAHPIGKGLLRNLPAFLNSNLLWFQAWSHPQCGESVDGNAQVRAVGRPLIYDTSDGSEAPTVIDQVYELWPATGYGYSGVWPPAITGY